MNVRFWPKADIGHAIHTYAAIEFNFLAMMTLILVKAPSLAIE